MAREPKARESHLSPIVLRLENRRALARVTRQNVTAQSVEEHAHDTFGTLEKAEHWLTRPNPLFSGKPPRQILKSDPCRVEAELVRIDYGVYA